MQQAVRIIAVLSTAVFLFSSPAAGQPLVFDGLIEPSEEVAVSSQVPGILEEVLVERGDHVQKGQVLARLKSDLERAAIALARAKVEFGKRKVMRNEEIFKKQLISTHEKDEMETELKVAELQLQEADAKLKLRTIESPIDGVVTERLLSPGEYVGEEAILNIARIDPLHVEVIVPAEAYADISNGMKAEVRPELPGSKTYIATVTIVDTVFDAASGTFGVRLELANPDHRLPAGLKCKVTFKGR